MKSFFKFTILFFIFNLLLINYHLLIAQTVLSEAERQTILDSLGRKPAPAGQISDVLTVSGYVENYYSFDFANPANHVRQPFVYSYNRQNEFNLKVSPTEKFSIVARSEYNSDDHGVIMTTGTANNFQTLGYSLNIDCLIQNNVVWRMEGKRIYKQGQNIYTV